MIALRIVPGDHGWPAGPMVPDPHIIHEHDEHDAAEAAVLAKLEQADDMTTEQAARLLARFEALVYDDCAAEWRAAIANVIAHMPGMAPALWMLFEHVMASRCDCFGDDSDVTRFRDAAFARDSVLPAEAQEQPEADDAPPEGV